MRSARGTALVAGLVAAVVLAGVLPAGAQSSAEKPKATEIGVSATEIHIAVIADVDNPIAPGLFEGAADGVKAGAAYLDSKAGGAGLAGRKVVVDFYDGHLNASDTRNASIQACQNDLAMVGGLVLFLTSVDDIVNCKDGAGRVTGLPDMPSTTVGIPEACAPTSFPTVGAGIDCTTVTQNPQTYFTTQGPAKWQIKQAGEKLHGPMLVGSDTKDAARGGSIGALGAQKAGVEPQPADIVAKSGRDPQSAYTGLVQQMKTDNANYALSASSVQATSEWLQEAQLQGLDMSKIWWNNIAAYGNKIVTDQPSVWEGMYQALGVLPFEEAKYNKTLAAFVKYAKAQGGVVDTWAAYSFESVIAFRDAVNAVVKAHGINGLTRANLMAGIRTLTNFDADGMAGTRSYRGNTITPCFVMVRFVKGRWVRQYPAKKGTFDCKPSNVVTVRANLLAP
jgi:hypothetical protein